jgi:pSer/pThr/pTyr-binding forkhead associated (FHA) protein
VTENESGRQSPPGGPHTGDTTTVFPGGLFPAAPEGEAAEDQVGGLESLSPDTALLVVKRGPNAGSRFPLDRDVVSAGRHPQSDIFLDDVTVSRRHAEFRRAGGGFEVSDVGSLNGTYVNREPIETSSLTNGDEVQIGKFRLVFLTGNQQEGSRPS